MNAYVIRLWTLKYNTADIARLTKLEESAVAKIIADFQDRCYAARQAGRAA